jgi:hypothetical protein
LLASTLAAPLEPRMRLALAAALAASLLLGACEGEEEGGPTMSPGSDCISCHTGGEPGRFTAAGTVFGRGDAAADAGLANVKVTIVGSGAGEAVTLFSNAAGNFYTGAALTPPLGVELVAGGVTVSRPSHHGGACAGCHQPANQAGAPPRVHVGVTTSACAPCH